MTMTPQQVRAPWWRCMLMEWAFKHRGGPWSNFAWWLSRLWAREQTHMALSAFFAGMLMQAIAEGEE